MTDAAISFPECAFLGGGATRTLTPPLGRESGHGPKTMAAPKSESAKQVV
jgi:hypothetical protein